MDFLAAETVLKIAFNRFIEMSLADEGTKGVNEQSYP